MIFEGAGRGTSTEHSEYTEIIMRVWRGKPSNLSDAKRFYDFSEGYYIEDKIEETNIPNKIKLPLISKKSIETFSREELFFSQITEVFSSQLSSTDRNLIAKLSK